MNSLVDRLPSRFPVGTRYVIEGRRQADGGLRISMRCLEFPDGRQVRLPSDKIERRRARRSRGRHAAGRK
jgi:TolB-like protein